MASFWILLSYLAYTAYNPITFICVGLLFPFCLFAGEIYLSHVSQVKINDEDMNSEDPELAELKLEHDKENLRASIESTRRQRALQDQMVSGKKPNKDDFRW